MFQGNGRESAEESYERKLELIRAVREENRVNRERIGRRHRLFYGEDAPLAGNGYGGYEKERGYGVSYAGDGAYGMEAGPGADEEFPALWSARSFALRVMAAAVCALLFWGIKEQKLGDTLPVSGADIRGFVAEDFSKQVVDYLSDFPYTFGYEKTSIE